MPNHIITALEILEDEEKINQLEFSHDPIATKQTVKKDDEIKLKRYRFLFANVICFSFIGMMLCLSTLWLIPISGITLIILQKVLLPILIMSFALSTISLIKISQYHSVSMQKRLKSHVHHDFEEHEITDTQYNSKLLKVMPQETNEFGEKMSMIPEKKTLK